MKLFWSSRSPYVRKAMVVAHEAGVADRIERVPIVVSSFKVNDEILRTNPLGKIPTLVLDDGTVLYDSTVICEYLDGLRDDPDTSLYPREHGQKFTALRWHALGNGMLDLLLARLSETRSRTEAQQAQALLDAACTKLRYALDHLETQAPALAGAPFSIGHVAVGSALSYLDFRFTDDAWRNQRSTLAEWHATFEDRPSVSATAHIDA